MCVKRLNPKMIIATMLLLTKHNMKTKTMHNNQYDYQWGNGYVNWDLFIKCTKKDIWNERIFFLMCEYHKSIISDREETVADCM